MKSGSPGLERAVERRGPRAPEVRAAFSRSGAAASSAASRTAGSGRSGRRAATRNAGEQISSKGKRGRRRGRGRPGRREARLHERPPAALTFEELAALPRRRDAARASPGDDGRVEPRSRPSPGARAASRRVSETRAVCPRHPFRSRFSSRIARDAGESGSAPSRRSAAIATPGRGSFARRRPRRPVRSESAHRSTESGDFLGKGMQRGQGLHGNRDVAARGEADEIGSAFFVLEDSEGPRRPRDLLARGGQSGSSFPLLSTARSAGAASRCGFRDRA